MVLIVAGTHAEAVYWARAKSLKNHEWRYAFGKEAMLGFDPAETRVWIVGTVEARPDYREIMMYARQYRLVEWA